MEALSQGYDQLGRQRRLLKKHESIVYWLQLFIDAALANGLLLLLVYMKNGSIDLPYRLFSIIAALLLIVVFAMRGVYRRSGSLREGWYCLFIAWSIFLFLAVFIAVITKTSTIFTREVFLTWAILGLILQLGVYTLMQKTVGLIKDHFSSEIRSVVIGNGRLGCHLASKINNNMWLPDRLVGFISTGDSEAHDDTPSHTSCLGGLDDLQDIVMEYDIRRVYIAVPLGQSGMIGTLHKELLALNVDLIWVPDIYELQLLNHSIREVAGMPLVCLNESPLTSTRTGIFLKEVLDRTTAAFLIFFLAPILIAIALLVKLTSKGPIIFKQPRHGWDSRVFKVWKFRSMYVHLEQEGEVIQAKRVDSRVTPVGRFLRKTSLDELPQLFNVLFGNMSLVGPRPHAVAHNDLYGQKIGNFLARHRIKPGITGLAQINGCRGETDTDEKMHRRAEYDMEYINNWSFWLDIKILLKTPFTLFSKHIY
ncbi:MAG: putative colanic acid biosynthesis UDP-glucose lipid carrier transferase [Cellvibrionaceae bacterium]|jgi:putative colanic acid biosynthesis UDP-glucose lipid carrier transferase